jgi:hypothetical protein
MASSRAFDATSGRGTPSGPRRGYDPVETMPAATPRSQSQARISTGAEPLPEISILPPVGDDTGL